MTEDKHRHRILIVEDDRDRAEVLTRFLAPGYECLAVHDVDSGLRALGDGAWRAALVDYSLDPRDSGVEFLQCVRDLSPHTGRILYSMYYSPGLIYDARRLASVHQVMDARPREFLEQIRVALDTLLDEQGAGVPERFAPPAQEGWIAQSEASREFSQSLLDVAHSARPVFLYGGPGTGKTFAGALLRRWRAEWRARGARIAMAHDESGQAPAILRVPALEERRADLPMLVGIALIAASASRDGSAWQLGPGVLDDLMRRSWDGNVRQLRTVIVRACHRATDRHALTLEDLPKDRTIIPASPSQYAKDEGQRQALLRQLRIAGSVARAAEIERVSRSNYIRLMRRLGIERVDVPPSPRQGESD